MEILQALTIPTSLSRPVDTVIRLRPYVFGHHNRYDPVIVELTSVLDLCYRSRKRPIPISQYITGADGSCRPEQSGIYQVRLSERYRNPPNRLITGILGVQSSSSPDLFLLSNSSILICSSLSSTVFLSRISNSMGTGQLYLSIHRQANIGRNT